MRRPSRLVVLAAAFGLGLALCVGLVLLMSGRFSDAPAFQGATVGGPIQLTDQNGQPFSDQSLRGKPFLVFFGFTHCPDVCPTALFEVSEIMRRLGPDAARAAALFISVDPERDTPAVLKEYLSSFDPNLQALTGDPAAIAAVAKAYRVYYKKVPLEGEDYTLDHTALVYLMDKQGRFVAPFNIKRPPEAAVADLRKYL
ncbi:MAG: SCO family protein [Rhodoplanes sp.]